MSHLREALEQIDVDATLPEGWDAAEWWKHVASKRREIAREALRIEAQASTVGNALAKAKLSARMLELTQETRRMVTMAHAAPKAEQLPLVIEALAIAVESMEAMTERMMADV